MTIQPAESSLDVDSNGAKLPELPTAVFNRLSKATTEAEILQAGVETVYQNLKCDRVVVYSMQSVSMCKITAEAVTPGYAQILNTTIEDPCFEDKSIDKYQKGRVQAITDIREAGMSLCYVESLERIDVKSSLVVPLTATDNSLYGLLIMHQCSRTRQWQQTEIEFTLSIADWLMKEVSRQKTYLDLQHQFTNNRHLQQLVTTITTEIHGTANVEEILQIAVDKAQELLNCDRVVVYNLQQSSMGEIVAEATVPALASILGSTLKDPCFEYRYIDEYQQGRIQAIANIYEAGMTSCYVDNLAKIGVKANLVAPINFDNGIIYGLLVAHQCFDFKDWQPNEIECFKQIAFHTGLSLSKAKLKQESALVERGLTELSKFKNTVSQVEANIEQIQSSIQNTGQILIEVNNLHKLLDREVNVLNKNSSPQTKKDTKLIQIIIKKLALVSSKLRKPLVVANSNSNEAKAILNQRKQNFGGDNSLNS